MVMGWAEGLQGPRRWHPGDRAQLGGGTSEGWSRVHQSQGSGQTEVQAQGGVAGTKGQELHDIPVWQQCGTCIGGWNLGDIGGCAGARRGVTSPQAVAYRAWWPGP